MLLERDADNMYEIENAMKLNNIDRYPYSRY